MQDEWARSVLAEPGLGPEPPSTVDVGRAVADGRRRVRARRATGVAAVAAGTALAVMAIPAGLAPRGAGPAPTASVEPHPSVPTACTVQTLPLPPGAQSAMVTDGEPSGRYLVGTALINDRLQSVRWDNGQPSVLPAAGSGEAGVIVVNATETVAFTTVDGESGAVTSWLRRGTTVTSLPGRHYVVDINARGDVLGAGKGGDSPVVWRAGRYDRPEPLSGGPPVTARALDDDGIVVGGAEAVDGQRPVYWSPDGAVHALPTPTGYGPGGVASHVRGGLVAGRINIGPEGTTGSRPAVWNLRTGAVTLVDTPETIIALNRHGWLVGVAADQKLVAAFGAQPVPLPLPAGAGDNSRAMSLSDDGRVIGGYAAVGDNRFTPVRWNCS